MVWFNSLLLAISTYSRLPVPQKRWSEEAMGAILGFFPVVGLLIGAFLLGWQQLCLWLDCGTLFFAAGATALPVLVTGGIHLDGFCDTIDGLSSHQTAQRKLEIMKDPHMGPFACMYCVLYLLIFCALSAELYECFAYSIFCAVFVLSRICSGLAALWLPSATKKGMLYSVTGSAPVWKLTMALGIWLLLTAGWMLWLWSLIGGLVLITALLCFLYYRHMAMRQFGGVTGDLAGYFLQICELSCLFVIVIGGKLWSFI